MNERDDGLSQESKKVVASAFSILLVVYVGLGLLMNGKMISPVIFAILAAFCMGVTFVTVTFFVIRKDGWGILRSQ